MTDLDAILSQLAEGHWPRPTAALGRAIVERIRGLEAAVARIREIAGALDGESTLSAVDDLALEHEHYSREMAKAGYETIPRLEERIREAETRADRLAAEVSELRAAGDAMAERLAYQHPECDRSVCAAAREAETWRALGPAGRPTTGGESWR